MKEGVGEMGGGVGGMGGDKTTPRDTQWAAMMPTQWPITHSGPHSQWEQIQVPTVQLAPSMGLIVPAVTLEG